MANFSINIKHPYPIYARKVSASFEEDCILLNNSTPIELVNINPNIRSVLSSYVGYPAKTLTISNITSSQSELYLSYNNVRVVNEDLPLIIDITGVGEGVIPNLKLEEHFTPTSDLSSLRIAFIVADINDNTFLGISLNSYFQVNKINCTT